jgi:hypothetical protein
MDEQENEEWREKGLVMEPLKGYPDEEWVHEKEVSGRRSKDVVSVMTSFM